MQSGQYHSSAELLGSLDCPAITFNLEGNDPKILIKSLRNSNKYGKYLQLRRTVSSRCPTEIKHNWMQQLLAWSKIYNSSIQEP
jgi:hypothetical protein